MFYMLLGLLLMSSTCLADSPVKPGPKEKCPVCGMFVSKYPEWTAQVKTKKNAVFFFDGAKDMFKFLAQPQKYVPGIEKKDVTEIYVTDYYSLNPIDGTKAFYVLGSDVYGPMGRELIPFLKEEEARAFLRDHHGKSILRFQEVTPQLLRELD